MSANQLIAPFRLKPDDEWNTKPRPHQCPRCTYMGGEGHPYRELVKLTRHEREFADEIRIIPVVKVCGYWSAKAQAYCKGTDRVKRGPFGPRCETHAL